MKVDIFLVKGKGIRGYLSNIQKLRSHLKNNKYVDMIFAVGQNTLGYANKSIDNEIKKYVSKGNMSTLNCPEEVFLSEKLLKLHKWAKMVKYARSGGEANAITIRIARAAAKNDTIAICGYHGWHDWYLSINLKSKDALNDHLLKGLDPVGVPSELKNKVYTFSKNNFNEIKKSAYIRNSRLWTFH